MTSKFTELAIDCADPNGLDRFWCSVLDYEVQDEDDGIITIGLPTGLVPEEGAAPRARYPCWLTHGQASRSGVATLPTGPTPAGYRSRPALTPHGLRHTYKTLVVELGTPMSPTSPVTVLDRLLKTREG